MTKIKVLIVDDSSVIRSIVNELLSADAIIDVVGEAEDPYQARELIKQLNPDVITLDVEMPKMDGITFLSNLMRLRPMPVVMLSTLTKQGADTTLEALELGAIDFIAKPHIDDLVNDKATFQSSLIKKVKYAASVKLHNRKLQQSITKTTVQPTQYDNFAVGKHILAIGASTGGTEAIKAIVRELPTNCPPVVVTQHIPPTFSARFADRLNSLCVVDVVEASHRQKIERGHVYIAPGDKHLTVKLKHGEYFCVLDDSPEVNRHKPSVDVLFNSLIPVALDVQAILLTGMGNDGAKGMLALKQAGARTIIQDEETSLIWGMPGSAAKLDAHQLALPLDKIANNVMSYAIKQSDQHKRGE